MTRSFTNMKLCRYSMTRVAPAALAFLGVLAGCAKQQAAPQPTAPIPVVVGSVKIKSMPVQVSAVGRVEPYSTIAIVAQVPGQLLAVHFKEADSVHKGHVVLTLDPRPYKAAH